MRQLAQIDAARRATSRASGLEPAIAAIDGLVDRWRRAGPPSAYALLQRADIRGRAMFEKCQEQTQSTFVLARKKSRHFARLNTSSRIKPPDPPGFVNRNSSAVTDVTIRL